MLWPFVVNVITTWSAFILSLKYPTLCGFNIYHHGKNISQHNRIKVAITSAPWQQDQPSILKELAIISATTAVKSNLQNSGNNISHKGNNISHYIYWSKSGSTWILTKSIGNNICHMFNI